MADRPQEHKRLLASGPRARYLTGHHDSISASEFKATCLDWFDRIASGEVAELKVTKRGRVVAVLHPPAPSPSPADLFGCLRGAATIAPGVDLTAPLDLDPLDAEAGLLHR